MSSGEEGMRSLSQISEKETVRFSLDLVAASRKNIGFLRFVNESEWLHQKSTLLEAIRRYDELWMPLIAELITETNPPMLVPPLDIEWIWFCHTLNPSSYREYCESRFSKLVGKPTIFDEENEEYALNRCREIWDLKYPSEPFENEADINLVENSSSLSVSIEDDLLEKVMKMRNLCRKFDEPYYSEVLYLVAARQRYKGFIYMAHTFANHCSCFVPTSDVLLMWITHKSYPTLYALDMKDLEEDIGEIIEEIEAVKEEDLQETKMLWERTFDQPYEKAGGEVFSDTESNEPPFYWTVTDTDVNTRYKTLFPRFLFEVSISVKSISDAKHLQRDPCKEFLRLRMSKCHKDFKIDKPLSSFSLESWQKALHLYCEFATKGMILELRERGGHCFKGSTVQEGVPFLWNDILRAPSLTLGKEIDQRVKAIASITPPVQAPYLLKCVPDRVTDDSGAMISDVILKMNQYHPQEGRWLSRTVLDHAGRECFVTRMRVGSGFWRRGGEVPTSVKWEERIIEIRQGCWSYVTGYSSIGKAPEKVVGTATPIERDRDGYQASWSFTTGHELLIQWDSSASISGLRFHIQDKESNEPMVKLLLGRHLQYEVKNCSSKTQERSNDEDDYVTMVRFSEENSTGKAAALLNWKLLVVEFLPEEDVVLVLLICLSILRSVSEMKREDIGRLLVRRRVREAKLGHRDWGSVILHPSSYSPSVSSSYTHPWYWNAKMVMAVDERDQVLNSTNVNYSQAEGGDRLYRSCIFP